MIWREIKPFLGVAIVVVVYAIVRVIYVAIADGQGIVTPGGHVDPTLVVLAISTLVLRFIVLVVVPLVVVYRIVMRVSRRWTE